MHPFKITRLIFLALISVACTSCVTPQKWPTPSGSPEITIRGSEAQGKVISRMIAKNWDIVNQSANVISFERQQLSAGSRAVFALGGDTMGIVEGWNVVLIPTESYTRVCLTSTYVKSRQYGKTQNKPNQKNGQEFLDTLSGL